MTETNYDVVVVGAGIVGLATARSLTRQRPGLRIAVVDKEDQVGQHQTGHNSGVLHSGLYYRPGSLKADLCVRGQRMMAAFCEQEGIDLRRSGKLVIASQPSEIPAMETLFDRGSANGLSGLRRLSSSELREIEPEAIGVAALHVPEAGVVDYRQVAQRLGEQLTETGVKIVLGSAVTALSSSSGGMAIEAGGRRLDAKAVVNCAGLHTDRVAAMAGVDLPIRVVPFRGEYYVLSDEAARLVRSLIYPVPDPRFPFLGVHFTRRVDGSVEVGPNAVLALGREHYRGTKANWTDAIETFRYRGFQRLAARYWRTGAVEAWRSAWRSTYARAARKLVPAVSAHDLLPAGSGVRAQAVTPDGRLLDDFSIVESERAVHVLNAPSPAATASLAIGDHIAGLVTERLD